MPRNELFVGNLNRDVSQRDLEKLFDNYGKVIRCSLKDKGKIIFILIVSIKSLQIMIFKVQALFMLLLNMKTKEMLR